MEDIDFQTPAPMSTLIWVKKSVGQLTFEFPHWRDKPRTPGDRVVFKAHERYSFPVACREELNRKAK